MTIPHWIARAFDRCESCCLDSQADRERLAEALLEELETARLEHMHPLDRKIEELALRPTFPRSDR